MAVAVTLDDRVGGGGRSSVLEGGTTAALFADAYIFSGRNIAFLGNTHRIPLANRTRSLRRFAYMGPHRGKSILAEGIVDAMPVIAEEKSTNGAAGGSQVGRRLWTNISTRSSWDQDSAGR
jgi:hypothetical protein